MTIEEVRNNHTDDDNYTHIDVYFKEIDFGKTVAIVCGDTGKVFYLDILYKTNKAVAEAIDVVRNQLGAISETKGEDEISYVLSEDSINGIQINKKIPNEDLFEYRITDREELISDLINWIGEVSGSDKDLMKDDLKMLVNVEDEYILSSISTNKYLYNGCKEFNDSCEELLKLNKKISKKRK